MYVFFCHVHFWVFCVGDIYLYIYIFLNLHFSLSLSVIHLLLLNFACLMMIVTEEIIRSTFVIIIIVSLPPTSGFLILSFLVIGCTQSIRRPRYNCRYYCHTRLCVLSLHPVCCVYLLVLISGCYYVSCCRTQLMYIIVIVSRTWL